MPELIVSATTQHGSRLTATGMAAVLTALAVSVAAHLIGPIGALSAAPKWTYMIRPASAGDKATMTWRQKSVKTNLWQWPPVSHLGHGKAEAVISLYRSIGEPTPRLIETARSSIRIEHP